ncbi:oligodendrocyte-myelin glycoprotein [Callorhinchus milii]|uniref:oligodendrocyte-myelin glycoprotein n=1 Tax=Callorhinchus milii TaxID=7868 RepID=UPI001C3FEFBD|nr:oligodendrocyte-myelin glycoprotein [Callorhinchus milii]
MLCSMAMGSLKLVGCLLAISLALPPTLATCPWVCLCSHHDRVVDCSGRNLTTLPEGILNNVTALNISHNSFENLDDMLTHYVNVRILDVSSNLLSHVPAKLPRALWEIHAANNIIKRIQKDDTASQWNLKTLDVSNNMIERAVLINNTLINLKYLNFSGNRFWSVPTNMPHNLSTLDLSGNNLVQILPGTFRQAKLAELYLNNNNFKYIPNDAFKQLTALQSITLYSNPWACNLNQNISYLLTWIKTTTATVYGCPCAAEYICDQNRAANSDASTPMPSSQTPSTLFYRRRQTENHTSTSAVQVQMSFLGFSIRTTNSTMIDTTTDAPPLATLDVTASEPTSDSDVLTQATTELPSSSRPPSNQTSAITLNTTIQPIQSINLITPAISTTFESVNDNATSLITEHSHITVAKPAGTIRPTSSKNQKTTVVKTISVSAAAHVFRGSTLYLLLLTMLSLLAIYYLTQQEKSTS